MQHNGSELPSRIREIRLEKFGEDGIATLSGSLGIPVRTWENFERGVAVPGWVLLQFLELTGVEPHWLLTGEGERFRVRSERATHRTYP